MFSGIFVKILSIFLLLAVGVVLILGIGTLFKGGETNKKYSNDSASKFIGRAYGGYKRTALAQTPNRIQLNSTLCEQT